MFSLAIAGGIYLLDHKIKEYADSHFLQGSNKKVLKDRLILRNCHNKDTAFGAVKVGAANCQELSAAGLGCVLAEYWRQIFNGNKMGRIGLAMVLGGGFSNYMDRRNKGYVTDYVSFNVKKKEIRKMVFNISDFCIIGGTVVWAIASLLPSPKKQKKQEK